MLSVVIPGRVEVRGREPYDVLQDLLVRGTQPTGIHDAPNRDPRVANAGPSAAHTWRLLNPALVLGWVCGHDPHLLRRHFRGESRHPGIQTPRNPDTQASRHPGIQTPRNPDTRNPDTQESRHPGIQTPRNPEESRHPQRNP